MYRSKLESLVGGLLGPTWDYEPFKVPYVTHRHYTPDFVFNSGQDKELLVEVKGFFRVGDTAKYKAIRDALAEESMFTIRELVFFLQNPRAKVRKGQKINMGQWCEKEGFEWFDRVDLLKEYADGHF